MQIAIPMNFIRLHDEHLKVLFENEEILAIDKPYGFNSHTNDSKSAHGDFIQDGLIEIYEKNLSLKLHVVHRLDQTTTGVMIFAKTSETAKKYADFFFNRQVKKTYNFITKHKLALTEISIEKDILHKGKILDARTDFKFVKHQDDFTLWQAKPFTGRNHQIRIHAKEAGIPILGDSLYNGHDYSFICLHNQSIEFPNGIIITSFLPFHFENLEILKDKALSELILQIDRRFRLYQLFKSSKTTNKDQIDKSINLATLQNELKKYSLKIKLEAKKIILSSYEPEKHLVLERVQTCLENWVENPFDIEFTQESTENLSLRLQKDWLQKNSTDKRVLNLFAYNNGFSLASAIGKAKEIISVDSNKNLLASEKEKFNQATLDSSPHKFLCRDVISYTESLKQKNELFDLIVCDIPSFVRREKKHFKIQQHLKDFINTLLTLLKSYGKILFSTKANDLSITDIKEIIEPLDRNLKLSCILPSLDFELPNEPPMLKSFFISLK